jgi:ribosomal protein S12 methylthiotransferase accessory factor
VWAGSIPPWHFKGSAPSLGVGGAGWTEEAARCACAGEAIERWQPFPVRQDHLIRASIQSWPLDEPAVPPERWVLFHPEQYALPGFPFAPFTRDTTVCWISFREALTGNPWWVPADLAFLSLGPALSHNICPGISTGLSCGQVGDPVLLRGLQEVIERDAVVGAWWGSYGLEVWDPASVFALIGNGLADRLIRPNLQYHFYRVNSPFSSHTTIVTLEGEDREGFCFSAGSACRQTRKASWEKAILEAVHGRHYVRHLLSQPGRMVHEPSSFAEHAVYYSLHSEKLKSTVLHRARSSNTQAGHDSGLEDISDLINRLGEDRPVLARNLTPLGLLREDIGWYVLKVLVPGLQPLHADHRLPHLGGSLWSPRRWGDWINSLPHPFP